MVGTMADEIQLTAVLEALANPVTREFIELVALQPRTGLELQKAFDFPLAYVNQAGKTLHALGLVTEARRGQRYDYDARGLALVRDWIARIESIRSAPRKDGV
jgi:DNA-binding IclR family transcriptional regulator